MMDPEWFPDRNRPSYNLAGVMLTAFLVQVTTLLLPSRLHRVVLGLPCFLFCAFSIRTHTARTTPDDYLAAVNLVWLVLRWIDLAILRQPEISLWQINAPDERKHKVPVEPYNLARKVKWSLSLCTTYRGVGWNWRVKNVDSVPADVKRSDFVLRQLLKFARVYVISDFVSYYQRLKIFPDPTVPDVFALPLVTKVAVAWAFPVRAVCDMSIAYYLAAAFAVSVHLSKPEDWPPVFGSWLELYSVRKAWGYCWHQWLRRIFEVYTDLMVQLLGFPRATLVTRYVKLYGAFFISACIHYCGALNVPWAPGTKYHFLFFVVQPFFITFEDLVIHIGKRLGVRKSGSTRALGYLWVFIAFSLSLPLMAKSFYDWVYFDGGVQKKHPFIQWSIAEHMLS